MCRFCETKFFVADLFQQLCQSDLSSAFITVRTGQSLLLTGTSDALGPVITELCRRGKTTTIIIATAEAHTFKQLTYSMSLFELEKQRLLFRGDAVT